MGVAAALPSLMLHLEGLAWEAWWRCDAFEKRQKVRGLGLGLAAIRPWRCCILAGILDHLLERA